MGIFNESFFHEENYPLYCLNSSFAILLLTSFAPYLFGQSRMLNHESMVGLFSLLTILAMTAHLFLKPTTGLAILSAGCAAFANLTKSSAIVLFTVINCDDRILFAVIIITANSRRRIQCDGWRNFHLQTKLTTKMELIDTIDSIVHKVLISIMVE